MIKKIDKSLFMLCLITGIATSQCAPVEGVHDQTEQYEDLAAILAITDTGSGAQDEDVMRANFLGGYGGGSGASWSWGNWSYYKNAYNITRASNVTTNGNCGGLFSLCTKSNYNYDFKESRCSGSGKNPAWYGGQIRYAGIEWGATGQQHGGICVTEHPTANVPIFHDGCTSYPGGSPGRYNKGPLDGWKPNNWGEAFHGACVIHDLCYKAEGSFSNRSQNDCDNIAVGMMVDICERSYENQWWLGPLNKRFLCKQNAYSEAWVGLLFAKKSAFTVYDMGYDWRPNAICQGSNCSYDVVTGQCKCSYTAPGNTGGSYGGYGGGG